MAVTKIKYSPSVNIIRDSSYQFNYIATPNATDTFTTILNDAAVDIKAHLLVGAYGTGKSSFLLALKQTLEGNTIHFKGHSKLLSSFSKYEFIVIVGESTSLEDFFATRYHLAKGYRSSDVIKAIDKEYKSLQKQSKGLAILIDEFGKLLEYAAKHNPEKELYFIQQLAEWINDVNNDSFLIATLHQGFSSNALDLNKIQQQEWDKVRGRIKEIPFNELSKELLQAS